MDWREIDAQRKAHLAKQAADSEKAERDRILAAAVAEAPRAAGQRIDLRDVTLVYTSDAEDIPITTLSVLENMAHANFGEVLLFSDTPWSVPGTTYVPCRKFVSDIGPTDPLHAIGSAMCFLWYNVPKYIKTKHFLVAQWDSWIINPARWTPEFLAYDYIGGPWQLKRDGKAIFQNGNGGFSFRSTAMARHIADNPDKYPLTYPRFEDGVLCRDHRPALEEAGFTFAPLELAAVFSFEGAGDPCFDMLSANYIVDLRKEKPFAFHALRNFKHVLTPEKMAERLKLVRKNLHGSKDFIDAARFVNRVAPRFSVGVRRF